MSSVFFLVCSFSDFPPSAWAQYIAVPASQVISLPDDLPVEQAAAAVINPLTVGMNYFSPPPPTVCCLYFVRVFFF
jgi:NADPH:quinone reductase-like Zn-dependent oxidoreductase